MGESDEESDQSSRPPFRSGHNSTCLRAGSPPGSSSPFFVGQGGEGRPQRKRGFCSHGAPCGWRQRRLPGAGVAWPGGTVGVAEGPDAGRAQQSRGRRFATAQKPSVPWGSRLRGRLGKKGSRPLWAPVAPAAPEPSPPPARPASPGPVCLLFSLPPPVGPLVTGFRAQGDLISRPLIRPGKQGHI